MKQLIFALGLILCVAANEVKYNVLLPNGEYEKNVGIGELADVLQEHYPTLKNDPELKERAKKIAEDMLAEATESAQLLTVPEEKEKLVGDTILKITDATVELTREFFYEKTGKHIIEVAQ